MNDRPLFCPATATALALLLFSLPLTAEPIPAPPGLVGWWPAETGGDNAAAAPAAALSAVPILPGKIGNGWQFNNATPSASSSGVIPATPLLQQPAFTIAVWVRFDVQDSFDSDDGGLQYLVFQGGSGVFEAFSLHKLREPTEQFVLTLGPAGSSRYGVTSAIPGGIQVHQWYFVAATYDGMTARLYVNGALSASMATGYTLAYVGSNPTHIGTSGLAYDGSFAGRMDELSFFNRVLSAEEIVGLFNAAEGMALPDDTLVSIRNVADVSWFGYFGRTYQVESSTDLMTWSDYGGPIQGNGDNHVYAPIDVSHRFFRVRRLP